MSLINDALKRASQSQKKPGPPDASGGAPMLPVDSPREKSFPLFAPILLAIIFLGVGSLLWRWAHNRESTASENATKSPGPVASLPEPRLSTPAPAASQSRIEINTSLVTRPIPSARPPATTVTAPPVESRILPAAPLETRPAPRAIPSPVETAPATFPPMKLQAVFYRLRNPTVVINGKTLSKGDEVDGARVVDIERMSVVVDWNGEKKTLKFEAP